MAMPADKASAFWETTWLMTTGRTGSDGSAWSGDEGVVIHYLAGFPL
jgi:hypothetical protein